MVTAFGREEVAAQAERAGIDAFLVKPVNASALYDTLMDLFGMSGAEPAGVHHHEESAAGSEAAGIRVLLAEDNEMNQQIAKELLESAGATVTIAGDGRIAVELLQRGPQPPQFDIVLMDLQMPEMDGYTATRLLRGDARFNDLPILAMTAHALVEERQRCLEAGMNDHITKPVDPVALFAALRRWAKPRPPAPSEATTPKLPVVVQVDLPAVEGVNISDGLNRVAGNRRLYRNLLQQFCEKEADAGDRIAQALETGDRVLAERLAHTLKGVAGNLGIAGVQNVAAKVERGIRGGESTVPALLTELKAALAPQVKAIRTAIAMEPVCAAAPTAAEFDPTAVAAGVAGLKELIATNDGEAAEALDGIADVLAAAAGAQRVAALREALGDFDFDRAAVELAEIADACANLSSTTAAK
jgi:CheY-like chemotaxis protein/HPt (histidine-containing phosphotransfer) domain-containing protein